MLPPNVETTLTLNEDGTYCLKQESTNDSDSSEVLNGIFKVLDGSILMLEHLSSGYNIFYKINIYLLIKISNFVLHSDGHFQKRGLLCLTHGFY